MGSATIVADFNVQGLTCQDNFKKHQQHPRQAQVHAGENRCDRLSKARILGKILFLPFKSYVFSGITRRKKYTDRCGDRHQETCNSGRNV